MWFLGLWNGFIAHHAEHLMRVTTRKHRRREELGKIGIILGLQNSEHFRTATTSIVSTNSGNVYLC
jgi:hypothetical protein